MIKATWNEIMVASNEKLCHTGTTVSWRRLQSVGESGQSEKSVDFYNLQRSRTSGQNSPFIRRLSITAANSCKRGTCRANCDGPKRIVSSNQIPRRTQRFRIELMVRVAGGWGMWSWEILARRPGVLCQSRRAERIVSSNQIPRRTQRFRIELN